LATPRRVPRRALAAAVVIATFTAAAGCKAGSSASGDPSTTESSRPTAAAAASNGYAAKSPRAIAIAAQRAFAGARSVHVRGTFKDSGDVVAIDLKLTLHSAMGAMRGPISGKSVKMELINANGALYLRGRKLWLATAGAAAAQRFGDKWVAVPKGSAPPQASFTLKSFQREVFNETPSKLGKVVKGKLTRIGGRQAIPLVDPSDHSTLYVAATGKPYPLRLVGPDGKQHMDLSGYGVPVTITKPANVVSF
jgi:hypothetical protein